MSRRHFGGTLGKVLLLLVFLAAMVGVFWWRYQHGVIGNVQQLTFKTAGYIAFVRNISGKSTICAVRADGSDLKTLTDGIGDKRSPNWSPDGRQLCFSAETVEGRTRTYQLQVLGAGDSRQATQGSATKDLPRWRPGGAEVAFLAGGVIKTMRINGADLLQIFPLRHKESTGDADAHEGDSAEAADLPNNRKPVAAFQWSPVGKSLAAIQISEGENAAMNGSGDWYDEGRNTPRGRDTVQEPETLVVLPKVGSPDVWPVASAHRVGFSWCPSGDKMVVVAAFRPGAHVLDLVQTDWKNLPTKRILQASPGTLGFGAPAVSPDGTRVAFEVWRSKGLELTELLGIAIVKVDAPPVRDITDMKAAARLTLAIPGAARAPQWSPDGSRIMYWKMGPVGRDVWVADSAAPSKAVNVTKGTGDNIDPVWSPAL